MRRGQPLVHRHPAAARIEQREVGERAADVDADAIHALCPACARRAGRVLMIAPAAIFHTAAAEGRSPAAARRRRATAP